MNSKLVLFLFFQVFALNMTVVAQAEEDIKRMKELDAEAKKRSKESFGNQQHRVDELMEEAKEASKEHDELHEAAESRLEKTIQNVNARIAEVENDIQEMFGDTDDDSEY